MTYTDVKGANSLAEFLMEGLSDETLFRIYKEKQTLMFVTHELNVDPLINLKEHVSNLYYTAGFNLVYNMAKDGLIKETVADHLSGE